MPEKIKLPRPEIILLDIEGTICPISFVKDVLFPYALNALPSIAVSQWQTPEFQSYVSAFPESAHVDPEALIASVEQLTRDDVKVAHLKNLQGYLWRTGYDTSAFCSPLFPDVVPALRKWHANGLSLAIYSSGSVEAQKMLLQYVAVNDDAETGEAKDGTEQNGGTAVLQGVADAGVLDAGTGDSAGTKRPASEKPMTTTMTTAETGDSSAAPPKKKQRTTSAEEDGAVNEGDITPTNQKIHESPILYSQHTAANENTKAIQDKSAAENPPTDAKPVDLIPTSTTTMNNTPSKPPPQQQTQDLRPLFTSYFDTVNAGSKTDPQSYTHIAESLNTGREPELLLKLTERVLFFSDNIKELLAARTSHIPSLLVIRPGNPPLTSEEKKSWEAKGGKIIYDFGDLEFE